MLKSKLKCFLIGHEWTFIKKMKEDVEIPLKNPMMAKTYTEKFSNIWKCVHCNNIVKTNLKKRPNNSLRKRFELLNDFFNVILK